MIEDQVRQAYDQGRVLRIVYQTPSQSSAAREREIEVYAFDETYVDAYCRLRRKKRTFRIDRIKSAALLDDAFNRDPLVEHQIKVAGLSKQAHECQRSCCREVVSAASPQDSPSKKTLATIRPFGIVWRILTLGLLG
jgi:predicted DNA-binding transcriptional regulator YafY